MQRKGVIILEEKAKGPEPAEGEEKKEAKEVGKKSSKTLVIIIAIVVLLLGLGLVGRIVFRKVAERFAGTFISKLISRQTGANVNVEGGGKKVSFSGKEGDFSFEQGGKLPDTFPKDFPIYPGAKLTSSWSSKGTDGDGISVVWETTDSFDKVSTYYKNELEAKGWKISSNFNEQNSATYSFEKDTISGFVGITKDDKKVTISATVGVKK